VLFFFNQKKVHKQMEQIAITEAAYFDLKTKVFSRREGKDVPIFTGTPINWGNSWMKPLKDFAAECNNIPVETANDKSSNNKRK
jgi:hypothetical protein